jgi:cobalt-zinc-cadmium efflux system protein
MEATPSHLKLK